MKLRRLLFILPLALALAACLDATGPRLPDEPDTPDDEPPHTGLVIDAQGH